MNASKIWFRQCFVDCDGTLWILRGIAEGTEEISCKKIGNNLDEIL